MIITKAELEAIAVKAAQYPEDSMAEMPLQAGPTWVSLLC